MPKAPKDQDKILQHVLSVFQEYDTLLKYYRRKWYDFFVATYHFETDRKGEGKSQIFFPKAFEQVEKMAPRITGNSPKFVINLNQPVNDQTPEANMLLNAKAAQMALNYFWKMGNSDKSLRAWAKNGLMYGTAFAKANFKRTSFKTVSEEVVYDEEGNASIQTKETEKVGIEYPTFEAPDILDIYFDPRVSSVDDMDAIIENVDNVSIADILDNKDEYFNLKEVKNLASAQYAGDNDNLKLNKFNLEGIPNQQNVKTNKTNLKVYYGKYCASDDKSDEILIKVTILNNSTLIGYEEIDFIPFELFNPIEIPNQAVGVGIVEPIKKLQDAYNLTRNQRFENVSLVINRMWMMKSGSGVDPRRLKSIAGNVIPVRELGDLQPIQTPDVTNSAFTEANSLNTEIQTTLGTIDTSQDNSGGGFTNLATGQKIRWNEYNVRFKAIKTNLEGALSRLGEKMLMLTAKEATKNPVIQDQKTQEFFEVAKTAFDQSSDFYTVSVVADSTAYDSIENAREEALGFGQLCIAYKAQGVPIDMTKIWADIVKTFQKDPGEYMAAPEQPQEEGGRPLTETQMEQVQGPQAPAEELNQQLTNV